MILLKIGPLFRSPERWKDGFPTMKKMIVFKKKSDEKEVVDFEYKYLNESGKLYKWIRNGARFFGGKRFAEPLTTVLICLQRQLVKKQLIEIADLDYDEVHVSYNDFDESAELFLLIRPFLRKGVRITRVYKESRPQYNYYEKYAFAYSNRIALNEPENVIFFEKKYEKGLFVNKEIVTGVDEDAIGKRYIDGFVLPQKLSELDGKKHVVILAGRVMSDATNSRSGSRLYYVPLIKEFIEAGLIVHLHTLNIIADKDGIDQYGLLAQNNPGSFYIEAPLDFENDWENAYQTLARYDYGVMHNYIKGTSNTIFDMYNIPHRYYEYLLAQVAPLLKDGETIVMQRMFSEIPTGIIYNQASELMADHHVMFKITDFKSYFEALYKKTA